MKISKNQILTIFHLIQLIYQTKQQQNIIQSDRVLIKPEQQVWASTRISANSYKNYDFDISSGKFKNPPKIVYAFTVFDSENCNKQGFLLTTINLTQIKLSYKLQSLGCELAQLGFNILAIDDPNIDIQQQKLSSGIATTITGTQDILQIVPFIYGFEGTNGSNLQLKYTLTKIDSRNYKIQFSNSNVPTIYLNIVIIYQTSSQNMLEQLYSYQSQFDTQGQNIGGSNTVSWKSSTIIDSSPVFFGLKDFSILSNKGYFGIKILSGQTPEAKNKQVVLNYFTWNGYEVKMINGIWMGFSLTTCQSDYTMFLNSTFNACVKSCNSVDHHYNTNPANTQLLYSTSIIICQQCNQNCYGCKDGYPNVCLDCYNNMFLNPFTNSCDQSKPASTFCQAQTVNNQIFQNCQKCDPSCKECSSANNPKSCTSCDLSSSNRYYYQNQCLPSQPASTYCDNNYICQSCNAYCSTCSNSSDNCQSCITNSYLYQNKCLAKICSLNQYLNPYSNNCDQSQPLSTSCTQITLNGSTFYYCQKCDPSCKECSAPESSNSCTSCNINSPNKYFYENQCQIEQPPATYCDANFICYQCDLNCSSCSISSSNCQSCIANKYQYFNQCLDIACKSNEFLNSITKTCDTTKPPGTFCTIVTQNGNSFQYCQKCDSTCQECDSPGDSKSCTSCNVSSSNKYQYKGQCLPTQPPKTFCNLNLECQDCDINCLTCTGSSNNCQSCIDKTYFYINQCYQNPLPGTYCISYTDCQQCDTNCKTCINSSKNCISCPDYQYLYSNSCQIPKPYSVYCEQSQNFFTCQLCTNLNCQECQKSDLNICTSCKQSQFLYKGDCIQSQPDSTYCQDNKCYDCDISCSSCNGPSNNNCITCKAGTNRSLVGTQCLCNEGYYEDTSKTCSQCSSTCLTCSDCLENFFLTSDNTCQQCYPNCLTCNGKNPNQCLTCQNALVLKTDKSCGCQPGYFVDSSNKSSIQCNKCDSTCLECQGSQPNQCISCNQSSVNKYLYKNQCFSTKPDQKYCDPVSNICQDCHINCSSCDDTKVDSCITCKPNLFQYNGQCYVNQPYSTYCNQDNVCHSCHQNCTSCKGSIFIKFEQKIWPDNELNINESRDYDLNISSAKFKNTPKIIYALTVYSSDTSSQQGFLLSTNSLTQTKLNYKVKSLGCNISQFGFNILAIDDPNIDVQQKSISSGVSTTIIGTQDIKYVGAFIYGFQGSSGSNLKIKYDLTKIDIRNYQISFSNSNILTVYLNIVIIYENSSQDMFQQLYSYEMQTDSQNLNIGGSNRVEWQTSTIMNSSSVFFGLKDFDISTGRATVQSKYYFGITIQSGQDPEAVNQKVKLNYFTWNNYYVNLINGIWMGFSLITCQAGYTMFLNSTFNSCVKSCNTVDHHYNNNPSNTQLLYSNTLVLCQQCDNNCYGCKDGYPKYCTDCYNNLYLNPYTNTCDKIKPSSTFCQAQSVSGQTFQNCQICDSTCKECSAPTDSKSCILCNSNSQNKYLYQNQCLNQQPPSTYCDRNYSCYDCDSDCLSCSNSSNNCQSCKPSKYLIQDTCLSQICSYQNQYYNPFTKMCQQSQPSGTSCQLVTFQNQSFLNCQKCDSSCKECSSPNSASSCTSCDTNSSNKYFYNNQCLGQQPQSTYYDVNFICHKCDSNCSSCFDSSSNCQSCVDYKYLNGNQCYDICSNNQYLNSITKVCNQNKPPGTYCNLVSQNGTNFYFCQKCDPTCLECNLPRDSKSCTSCDVSSQNKYFYKNQCLNTQPPSTFCDQTYQCYDCDSKCQSCQNSNKNCQSCKNNTYFYQNQCLESPEPDTSKNCTSCNDNQYLYNQSCSTQKPSGVFCQLNKNYYQCQACSNLLCQECQIADSAKCISCSKDQYLYKDTCFQQQPNSTYCYNGKCYDCDSFCSSCNGPSNTNCTQCKVETYRILVGTQCLCKEGYYEDNNKNCQQCSSTCLTCSGPSEKQCLTCKNYIYQNTCYDNPPDGTYCDSQTKQCNKCDQTCLACSGPKNRNCTICDSNKFLYNGQCYVQQPYSTYCNENNVCQSCHQNCTSCKGYRFFAINQFFNLNKTQLQTCSNQLCQECQIADSAKCIFCPKDQYLYQDNCFQYQPKSTYCQDGKCQDCDSFCSSCNGPSNTNCTACKVETYRSLVGNQCQCKEGYYEDTNKSCQYCSSTCLTCSGPSEKQCLTCKNYIYQNTCYDNPPDRTYCDSQTKICNKCDQTCLACSGPNNDNCTICDSNQFLYNGQCYDQQPNSTYCNENNVCQSCHPNCTSCKGYNRVFIKFEQQIWDSSSLKINESRDYDFDISSAKFKNTPKIIYALTIYNSDTSSQQGFLLSTNSLTQTKLNYKVKSLGCNISQFGFNILAIDDPNIDVQQKSISSGVTTTITGTQDIKYVGAFIYGFQGSSGSNLKIKYDLTKIDIRNYQISFSNSNIQTVQLNIVIIYENSSQDMFQQLYSYEIQTDSQDLNIGGDKTVAWQTSTIMNSSPVFFGLKDFDITSGRNTIFDKKNFGIKILSGQTPEAINQKVKLNYFTWNSYYVNLINGIWMGFSLTTCQAGYTMFLNSTFNSCVKSCKTVDHHYNNNPSNTQLLYNNTLVLCQQCDNNCYGCKDGYPKQCTDCYNNLYLNPYTNTCDQIKPSSTFCQAQSISGQTFQNCQICDSTCKECSAPTDSKSCTLCNSNSQNKYLYQNQCLNQQPPSTYCDRNYNCYDCDSDCLSCSNSSNNCQSCKPNKYLIQDTCLSQICSQQNQYYNPFTKMCQQSQPSGTSCQLVTLQNQSFFNCQKCDSSCKECSSPNSASSCTSCDTNSSNKYFYNNQCLGQQPPSTYCDVNFICHKCDSNCSSCFDSSSNCQSCIDNKYWNANQCYDICSNNQYLNSITKVCDQNKPHGTYCNSVFQNGTNFYFCQKCDPTCLECNSPGDSKSCTSQSPEPGIFCKDYNNCSQCDVSCKTCIDSSKNCTSCNDNQYLYNQSCQTQKPSGVFCQLNKNYYQCQACSNQLCQECQIADSDKCISCPKDQYLYKDNCFQSQPKSTYCQDGKCQDCDSFCSSCNGPFNTNCTACKVETYRSLVGHQCQCKEGYYEDTNKNCQQCSSTCLTCKGPSEKQCLTCKNYIYQNTCYDDPPVACLQSNCSQCNKSGCSKCQSGYTLNDSGDCVYCDNKMYANSLGICNLPCKQGCKTCTSIDKCIYLDDTYKNCDVSCQTCSGPSSSECVLCSSNTRFFDSTNNTCKCIANFEEVGQSDCQYIYQIPKSIANAQSLIGIGQFSILSLTTLINLVPGISYSVCLMQLLGNFYIRQDQTYSSQASVLSSFTKYNLNSLFQQKLLYPSSNNNQKVNRILQQNLNGSIYPINDSEKDYNFNISSAKFKNTPKIIYALTVYNSDTSSQQGFLISTNSLTLTNLNYKLKSLGCNISQFGFNILAIDDPNIDVQQKIISQGVSTTITGTQDIKYICPFIYGFQGNNDSKLKIKYDLTKIDIRNYKISFNNSNIQTVYLNIIIIYEKSSQDIFQQLYSYEIQTDSQNLYIGGDKKVEWKTSTIMNSSPVFYGLKDFDISAGGPSIFSDYYFGIKIQSEQTPEAIDQKVILNYIAWNGYNVNLINGIWMGFSLATCQAEYTMFLNSTYKSCVQSCNTVDHHYNNNPSNAQLLYSKIIVLCQQCDNNCYGCKDGYPNQCTDCYNSQYLNPYTNTCEQTKPSSTFCQAQSVNGQTFQNCYKCDATCQECSSPTNPKSCTLCNLKSQNKYFYQNQCLYKQPPSTYCDSNFNCYDCDSDCLSCSNSSNNCQSCKPNKYQIQDTCLSQLCSQQNQYYNPFTKTCQQSQPSGTSCQLSTLQGQSFLNCQKCDSSCKECSSPNNASSCTSCYINSSNKYFYNNQCLGQQPPSTYCDDYFICHQCEPNCSSCFNSSNNCQSCIDNKYLNANQCFDMCSNNQYLNSITKICDQNKPSGTYCNYVSQNGTTFYFCQKCHPTCLECNPPGDSNSCVSCDLNSQNKYLYKNKCLSTQPSSTFCDQAYKCDDCDSKCKSCSNSNKNCQSCQSNIYLYQNQCLEFPQPGTYCTDYNNCSKCDEHCKTCLDTPKNCISCYDNQYLYNQFCQTQKPSGVFCKQDQNFFTCQTCKNQLCQECQIADSSKCISCPQNQYLYQDNCFQSQPNSTYCQDGKCYDCDSLCSSCNGPSNTNCTACKVETYRSLVGTQCLCKEGYYEDTNKNCKQCSKICLTCNGPSDKQCLTCKNYIYQNTCYDNPPPHSYCDHGYTLNDSGDCVYCDNKMYANSLGICILPCKQGCKICISIDKCIYLDDTYKNCDVSCQTCSGPSSSECVSCSSNTRFFDSTSNTCKCIANFEEVGQPDCQYIYQVPLPIANVQSLIGIGQFSILSLTTLINLVPGISYSICLMQLLGNFYIRQDQTYSSQASVLSSFTKYNLNSLFQQKLLYPSSNNNQKVNRILQQNSNGSIYPINDSEKVLIKPEQQVWSATSISENQFKNYDFDISSGKFNNPPKIVYALTVYNSKNCTQQGFLISTLNLNPTKLSYKLQSLGCELVQLGFNILAIDDPNIEVQQKKLSSSIAKTITGTQDILQIAAFIIGFEGTNGSLNIGGDNTVPWKTSTIIDGSPVFFGLKDFSISSNGYFGIKIQSGQTPEATNKQVVLNYFAWNSMAVNMINGIWMGFSLTTCQSGYTMFLNSTYNACVKSCNSVDHHYNTNPENTQPLYSTSIILCQQCNQNCYGCKDGYPNFCLDCYNNMYLNPFTNTCDQSKPASTFCQAQTVSNQIFQNCQKCDPSCQECSTPQSSNSCTSCNINSSNKYFYKNQCYVEQPPSTYCDTNFICYQCDKYCISCSGSSSNCQKCKDKTYLYKNQCTPFRPKNAYCFEFS
ncbi:hypothetical protein ABPG74_007676 [Tetrahymena malaccensis]